MKNLKKINLIIIALVAIISFSCATIGEMNEGPPRYDTDGKKVSGRDLSIDECLEYNVVKYTIRSLDKKSSERTEEVVDKLMDEYGRLKGHIVNNSNKNLDLTIINSSDKVVRSINISRRRFVEIYLTPGKDYMAVINYDKQGVTPKYYPFSVMPDVRADYMVEYRNRETDMLNGYFYIDDKKFK